MAWYCWLSAYVVGYFLNLWVYSLITPNLRDDDVEGMSWACLIWPILSPVFALCALWRWCANAGFRKKAAEEKARSREADIRNTQTNRVCHALESLLQESWHARDAVRVLVREIVREEGPHLLKTLKKRA